MRFQKSLWTVVIFGALLVLGCSSTLHHGGPARVDATGHAQWVGGPSGADGSPATGVSYKILANGSEMGSGVTDSRGNFGLSIRDGEYTFTPDPASGCPDLPFTIPAKDKLTVTCQRR